MLARGRRNHAGILLRVSGAEVAQDNHQDRGEPGTWSGSLGAPGIPATASGVGSCPSMNRPRQDSFTSVQRPLPSCKTPHDGHVHSISSDRRPREVHLSWAPRVMPRDAGLSRPAANPPTRLLVRVSGTLDSDISRAPRMRIRSVLPLTGTPDLGVPTPQVATRRPEDEHRDAARVARGQAHPWASGGVAL